MKKTVIGLAATLMLTGCSYNQFGATATGSGLGGMFGSAIGGLVGGPRGSDIGTVVGMVSGGVTGAAVSGAIEQNRTTRRQAPERTSADDVYAADGVSYSRAKTYTPQSSSHWQALDVTNVQYADHNDNHALDAGEEAYITFEIHNTGNAPIYDVAPRVSCSDKAVSISPVAIISSIAPGQGVRYKAAVVAGRRLHKGEALFKVTFGTGQDAYVARTFRIATNR